MHARGAHPVVRVARSPHVERARRIRIRVHGVARLDKREREEGRAHLSDGGMRVPSMSAPAAQKCRNRKTYVGSDAGQDDLFLARRLDGGAEVSVVPCIDLTIAFDEWRVGMHINNLLDQLTVRT